MAAPGTVVRVAAASQRALWLLAAESIRAAKGSGEVALFGNRYWSAPLSGQAGKRVTVRFDPDHLAAGVDIYDLDDRLVCHAPRIEDAGFDDAGAAREHNRKRTAYLKSIKEQGRLAAELSAEQLARLYTPAAAARAHNPRPKVVRLAGAAAALSRPQPEQWDAAADRDFGAALRLVVDNGND